MQPSRGSRRSRASRVLLLGIAGALAAPSLPARAATAPHILTVYRHPVTGATRTVTTPLAFHQPIHIDADRRAETGDQLLARGADLRARISPAVTGLGMDLQVDRLDMRQPLPLSFTVVYPSGGDVFTFGFDLRHADTPAAVTISATTAGVLTPSLTLSVSHSGIPATPAAPLHLQGEVYREGSTGSHLDATLATVTLAPAPGAFSIAMGPTLLDTGQGTVDVSASAATTLTMRATSVDEPYNERYDLTIDPVPAAPLLSSSLRLASSVDPTTGDDLLTLTHAGGQPDVTLAYEKRLPSRIVETMTAGIVDLPAQIDLRLNDAAGSASLTASAPIGLVRYAQASSTSVETSGVAATLPLEDYFYASEIPGAYRSAAVQIHGLSEATFAQTATGMRAVIDAARVPFRILLHEANDHEIRVDIDRLPDRIELNGDLDEQLTWVASDPIGELRIDAYDANGFGSTMNSLRATIRGLPPTLTLTLQGAGGAVGIDAGGQAIEYLEFVMSRDRYEVLPYDTYATSDPSRHREFPVDGILIWDHPSLPPVIAARFPGLKSISGNLENAAQTAISIRSNGLPRFHVAAWQPEEFIRADLWGLDPVVDLTMSPWGAGQRVTYTASGPQQLLRFSSNRHDGSAWMWGQLHSPLPAAMVIGFGVDDNTKVYFDADRQTRLDYADSDGNSLTNGWLTHAQVGSGDQWFSVDTNWHRMGGDFRTPDMRVDIRDYWQSDDYRFSWSECFGVPCWYDKDGAVSCNNVYVTTSGVTFNAEDIAC